MGARGWTAVLLAAGSLAACGDDGTASTDSVAPSTTAAAATTSTTIASVESPFIGGCTEHRRTDAAAPGPAEDDLATFGPLAAEPGLTITLPLVNASFHQVVPTAARIPGGVLIVASTDRSGYPAGGTLAPAGAVIVVVDDDGGVRWVRCLDRTATLESRLVSPRDAFVRLDLDSDATTHLLSLADGTIDDAPATVPEEAVVDHPTWDYSQVEAPLQYVAAEGTVQWADPSLVRFGVEGGFVVGSGDIVVAVGCLVGHFVPMAEVGCDAPLIRGYRVADGHVMWERSGLFVPSLGGDGYALVASVDNWIMIDARTGEGVPGQLWTRDLGFAQGCCDDVQTWAVLAGGVVIASSDRTIRVYYPAGTGIEPHEISLP